MPFPGWLRDEFKGMTVPLALLFYVGLPSFIGLLMGWNTAYLGVVVLKNGLQVPVSRSYLNEVRTATEALRG